MSVLLVICLLASGIISIQLAKVEKAGVAALTLFAGVIFGLILASTFMVSSKLEFWAIIILSL